MCNKNVETSKLLLSRVNDGVLKRLKFFNVEFSVWRRVEGNVSIGASHGLFVVSVDFSLYFLKR